MGMESLMVAAVPALIGVAGNLLGSMMGSSSASSYDFNIPTELPAGVAMEEISDADLQAQAKAERDALERASKQNVLTSDAGVWDEPQTKKAKIGDDIFGDKYGVF